MYIVNFFEDLYVWVPVPSSEKNKKYRIYHYSKKKNLFFFLEKFNIPSTFDNCGSASIKIDYSLCGANGGKYGHSQFICDATGNGNCNL